MLSRRRKTLAGNGMLLIFTVYDGGTVGLVGLASRCYQVELIFCMKLEKFGVVKGAEAA
jgi:hypothetical protein